MWLTAPLSSQRPVSRPTGPNGWTREFWVGSCRSGTLATTVRRNARSRRQSSEAEES